MKFLGNFEEFISGYGIWILVGVLGLAFIISVIFLVLNIYKANKINSISKETPIVEAKEEIIEIKTEEKSNNLYSVNYDEKTKEWVVKKAGASRASKRCATKKEANEFIEKVLKNKDK